MSWTGSLTGLWLYCYGSSHLSVDQASVEITHSKIRFASVAVGSCLSYHHISILSLTDKQADRH